MLVFTRLRIPEAEQHRVLFWGILGALVARAAFIAGGTALLARWHDLVYGLGIFLIYTAYRTIRARTPQHGETRVMRFLRRNFLPHYVALLAIVAILAAAIIPSLIAGRGREVSASSWNERCNV